MSADQEHAPEEEFTAEAVEAFLDAHPSFFEGRDELVARLRVPHSAPGGAVSLIERQVAVLREENERLSAQLQELLEVARDNDGLTDRLHRLTLSLIDAATFEEVVDVLEDELHDQFRADAVELRLFSAVELEQQLASEQDRGRPAEAAKFREFLDRGRPVCGQLGSDQLAFLFGPLADDIGSAALIPIRGEGIVGVLAIGSRDEARFHAGKGTHFLARLGEIVSRTLQVVSVPGA
ncbi:MAG: DUF484 family protein [Chromatiales bacterium]